MPAATGAQLWVQRYNGSGNGYDYAYSVAVSPGGDRVFVTGTSQGLRSSNDYTTAAYDAATGAPLRGQGIRHRGQLWGCLGLRLHHDCLQRLSVQPSERKVALGHAASPAGRLVMRYAWPAAPCASGGKLAPGSATGRARA